MINNEKLIDCIWSTRKPENIDYSLRDYLGFKVQNHKQDHYIDIMKMFLESDNEQDALLQVVNCYNSDEKFRESIDGVINLEAERYMDAMSEFMGAKSLLVWCLRSFNCKDEFHIIREKLIDFYIEERSTRERMLHGAIIAKAPLIGFDWTNVLSDFDNYLMLALMKRAVKDANDYFINKYREIIEYYKYELYEADSEAYRSYLTSQLYVFDLNDDEIERFINLTYERLLFLIGGLSTESKNLLIKSLSKHDVSYLKNDELDNFIVTYEVGKKDC